MAAGNEWLRYRASAAGLDWAEAAFVDHRFSPHRHDTYALGITTRGVQRFTYRGAARQALAGDVFVLHPDELHDGGAGSAEGFGYKILYVDPARIGAALGGAALPFVAEPVARNRAISVALRAVFPHPADPREEIHEADAVAALAAVLSRLAGTPPPRAALNPAMARLRAQLAADCAARLSLAELERDYGLDRYSIARQFRRAFGVSPSRFVTLRRVELAQRLVGEGRSLAEAAAAAGFADQSHMTRQFRAAFGTTPGKWRALLRAA
ncbi:MAG: helix-turn-helix domain-containing protein [Kiloniellaceae bacterium]|nr:helix-turn-helix domain-containing protein [Kiloniellaceae bacterium]